MPSRFKPICLFEPAPIKVRLQNRLRTLSSKFFNERPDELGETLKPDIMPEGLHLRAPVADVPAAENTHPAQGIVPIVHRHMDQ